MMWIIGALALWVVALVLMIKFFQGAKQPEHPVCGPDEHEWPKHEGDGKGVYCSKCGDMEKYTYDFINHFVQEAKEKQNESGLPLAPDHPEPARVEGASRYPYGVPSPKPWLH